jgi:hypothetical protein
VFISPILDPRWPRTPRLTPKPARACDVLHIRRGSAGR